MNTQDEIKKKPKLKLPVNIEKTFNCVLPYNNKSWENSMKTAKIKMQSNIKEITEEEFKQIYDILIKK